MKIEDNKNIDFAEEIDFGSILTNPILDIAARVWSKDRYDAFKICYRSMRVMDDLVDDLKADLGQLPEKKAAEVEDQINRMITSAETGRVYDPFLIKLLATSEKFKIPFWPWKRLGKAMIYDLRHNGFDSFRTFLRYTEGAAIAPAAIFTHLCGVSKEGKKYRAPDYDIRQAARPLALFSYLVHILRDFQKDQRAGLNYYAGDILSQTNVTLDDLKIAANDNIYPDNVRALFSQYKKLADHYRILSWRTIEPLLPLMESRYQLSLRLIYELYLQIFEKIDPENGSFSSESLNPAPQEIKARINNVLSSFIPVN